MTNIVTKEQALEALESMDDYAAMPVSVDPKGPYSVLKRFIEQREDNGPSLVSETNQICVHNRNAWVDDCNLCDMAGKSVALFNQPS